MALCFFYFEDRLTDRLAHFVCDQFRILFFILFENISKNLQLLMSFRQLVHCKSFIRPKPVLGALESVVEINVFDEVK